MNLYFKSFDQVIDEKGFNIATATLRLYRIPTENITRSSTKQPDCDGNASTEEEKLLRVSIYWYTKSPRKKKGNCFYKHCSTVLANFKSFSNTKIKIECVYVSVKKRLSDSKVILENARWVELSVKPATKSWAKGRNLGLAVLVEDQEGNTLKANRLFKGALCTVGACEFFINPINIRVQLIKKLYNIKKKTTEDLNKRC